MLLLDLMVDSTNEICHTPAIFVMEEVFPAILMKSTIQPNLVKNLTDFGIAIKYRERQKIRDAICDYLTVGFISTKYPYSHYLRVIVSSRRLKFRAWVVLNHLRTPSYYKPLIFKLVLGRVWRKFSMPIPMRN